MWFWILLSLLILVIYFGNQHYFSYWSKCKIPFKEPTFLFGELWDMFASKKSQGQYFASLYQNYKHQKVVGLYFSYQPTLLVCDPEMIQEVLIKDFSSFHDRGFAVDEENDPLTSNIFGLNGQRWRDLRVKLSPTFTSGKLKGMYPTIFSCAQVLQNYIGKEVKNGNDTFDTHDLLGRFTTNVISSVAFGIENDCINDRENIFRKMGMKIFDTNFAQVARIFLTTFLPKLMLFLKIKNVSQEIEDFIMSVVRQSIQLREKDKVERKDFMQLMIQLKNQGFVSVDKDEDKDDTNEEQSKNSDKKKLTFNEIAGNTFIFFAAGFETSSSTSNLCLFELSRHPEIQKKVQEEIDQAMENANSSEITYDILQELKYLEMCINETLRKYPVITNILRKCTKDHTFTGTKFFIKKGTTLFIPVEGLHRDPAIFENPLAFIPERFKDSPTGLGKSKGTFYLPFGDGPRYDILKIFNIL